MTIELQDTAIARKARGAFYTPPELCDYITDWALRTAKDTVLEPSCGEAAFLLSAGESLKRFGASADGMSLHGVEIHEQAAATARTLLEDAGLDADISVIDFFNYRPDRRFDVAVGNPPYVRYQEFTGAARSRAMSSALRAGVELSAMASSWAGFVVHASQLIGDDGRLGLVLPAELMHSNYAREVRRFLLDRFSDIRIILFQRLMFEEASEEVVLLLAEGRGPARQIRLAEARDVEHLWNLSQAEWVPLPLDPDANWMKALIDATGHEALDRLSETGTFEPLSSWGPPRLGMVTGANSYFTLSEVRRQELGLPMSALLQISPPGSRHLRGTTFTSAHWRALRDAGENVYLFAPGDGPGHESSVCEYIRSGEAAGVDTAYKCRVRDPWWQVPLGSEPDLFLTYMNHDAPRLVSNSAKVRYLNSVHGLHLVRGRRRIGRALLPTAFLNSATLLSAELVGRSYGGGVLKIEPGEGRRLLVPSLQLVQRNAPRLRSIRSAVQKHLRNADLRGAVALVDKVLLDPTDVAERTAAAVSEARESLFLRRASRS